MLNELLRYVWNLLQERGGALLGLARKGLAAIRSLLGNARGLLRSVLKRIVSFVASKVGPAAASASEAVQSSLGALKRRVEAVMRGEPAPAEVDLEERDDAAPATDAGRLVEEPVPAGQQMGEPDSDVKPVDAAAPAMERGETPAEAPASKTPASELGAKAARRFGEPATEGLAVLAPVLRRAFVRALGSGRSPSPVRSVCA